MEQIYLPKHLLMPFFDGKPVFYKTDNKEEKQGRFGLTVFGNGSVSLQLYSQSTEHGVVHSGGQTLTNDMLDKVFWDEGRRAFVGHL